MPFTTETDIKPRLAGLLKQDSSSLPDYFDTIIADSRNAAYQEIVTRLASRGFTLVQISAWDRGAEFETDIAIYWCLVKGAGLGNYDDKFISKLDRRKELDDVDVTTGGTLILPLAATGDQVGFGYPDDSKSQFSTGLNNSATTTVW